ncbi:MAG: 5'/3'-nucleotidase SurE [Candidatus Eremiobacteraeota bacterium]|nr:5'/3'-nucleotidase SurE [Candidatus Eremiobacteraeota bacterium]
MDILITNDDGINAPGLIALIDEAKRLGNVIAVAPHQERSAIGHGITFFHPLRMHRVVREKHCQIYSSTGTPTDCILLGLTHLMKKKRPDIIITGINRGPNIGDDITYSGTVSSAMEGALRGIPSMAVSVGEFQDPRYDTAAVIALRLVPLVLSYGLPPRTLLNVNVPSVELDDIKGIAITRQGRSSYVQSFLKRRDPRGHDYFWFNYSNPSGNKEKGTDFDALSRNYVSVTPLQLDLTCHATMGSLKEWDLPRILKES